MGEESRRLGLETIQESSRSGSVTPSQTAHSPNGGHDLSDNGKEAFPANEDPAEDDDDEEEEFTYPPPLEDLGEPAAISVASEPAPTSKDGRNKDAVPPSPGPSIIVHDSEGASAALLEALYAVASSGDLLSLQNLFKAALEDGQTNHLSPSSLANDAAQRTGLTVLHAAASRGRTDVVKWLVEECGALVDYDDKEGETALHKAALHGHLPVVIYLLSKPGEPADIHQQDADGWTALHNACSKGYLDIVRWLCERGGAAGFVSDTDESRVRGVDRKSKGGWTPLMNAASKGHLPVVLYLVTKQAANPLIRNNWGETAYDAAAAVFEVWICEVLQRAEAERWQGSMAPYDPLAVHTTVPLLLYEHQRLDARFKTLAVSGGRPKFSASGLGKRGRRSPFELVLPYSHNGPEMVPAWRSDVQLPLLDDPFNIRRVNARAEGSSPREGAERSFFWLSDWTLDFTCPKCDATEGWQYSRRLDDPDDQWTSEPPPQLERLLTGAGAMTAGLMSPSTSGRPSDGPTRDDASATTWVRRRRWVRVMRRRLDIPPLPFLEPDGSMYVLQPDGSLIPYLREYEDDGSEGEGQELGSMPQSYLSSAQDYVSRAKYMAGSQHPGARFSAAAEVPGSRTPFESPGRTAADVRRAIGKLERAVSELRTGMLNDEDVARQAEAEALLVRYSQDLDKIRLSAGAEGMFIVGGDDGEESDEGDDSDESFHYPGRRSASPTLTHSTVRPPSVRSRASNVDYFNLGRPSSSRASTDHMPDLSQAPEFRVPTHEAPQKVVTPRWNAPTPHPVHPQWERDVDVVECRSCRRRFTFLLRKHCRRCGRIFCDRCSSHRVALDPVDIIHDPTLAVPAQPEGQHRVCETCFEQASANAVLPGRLRGGLMGIVVDQERLTVPGIGREASSSSQLSDLADCPVCGQNLAELGAPSEQEAHVKSCLEGGSATGGVHDAGKYLVYRLPAESALIGSECVICLEEFVKGSPVARLSCLCTFHNTCLSAWLQRGRSCPVHARDT